MVVGGGVGRSAKRWLGSYVGASRLVCAHRGLEVRLPTCECGDMLRNPFHVGVGVAVSGMVAASYQRWPAGLGLVWWILGSHNWLRCGFGGWWKRRRVVAVLGGVRSYVIRGATAMAGVKGHV
jgi:hypothetical protein